MSDTTTTKDRRAKRPVPEGNGSCRPTFSDSKALMLYLGRPIRDPREGGDVQQLHPGQRPAPRARLRRVRTQRPEDFWKIDYYDRASFGTGRDMGSEDPSDPAQTLRVLTIMLASEY